ncbi:hypothetical protein [Candidatus Palauibacter sp.]|uniref:hypothetical protein n=1 Tax=Candidatus Palauibacter sp. TaxID=3101350 RepID=UPI003B02C204
MRGVLVRLVLERLEDGEIGGLLAPGQLPVRRLVRVERPDAARLGVVQPHAVADPVRRVERHGKQVPTLLPRESRHVTEAHRLAPVEIPNERVHAGVLAVGGPVAAERQIPAVIGEGERLHRVDILPFPRPKVEKSHAVPDRLPALPQVVAFVGGHADGEGEPAAVRPELWSRALGDDHDGIGVRPVDAKLRTLVHATDHDREPASIGRQRRLPQALPLVVVVRSERGLVLGCRPGGQRGNDGGECKGEDRRDSPRDVPHLSVS